MQGHLGYFSSEIDSFCISKFKSTNRRVQSTQHWCFQISMMGRELYNLHFLEEKFLGKYIIWMPSYTCNIFRINSQLFHLSGKTTKIFVGKTWVTAGWSFRNYSTKEKMQHNFFQSDFPNMSKVLSMCAVLLGCFSIDRSRVMLLFHYTPQVFTEIHCWFNFSALSLAVRELCDLGLQNEHITLWSATVSLWEIGGRAQDYAEPSEGVST